MNEAKVIEQLQQSFNKHLEMMTTTQVTEERKNDEKLKTKIESLKHKQLSEWAKIGIDVSLLPYQYIREHDTVYIAFNMPNGLQLINLRIRTPDTPYTSYMFEPLTHIRIKVLSKGLTGHGLGSIKRQLHLDDPIEAIRALIYSRLLE